LRNNIIGVGGFKSLNVTNGVDWLVWPHDRNVGIQYPGVFYHVTCRGNEGKNIFVDQGDRTVFLIISGKDLKTV